MASPTIQLISKKLVKPSTPTPLSLRNYKLSLFDQHWQDMYSPLTFFYPKQQYSKNEVLSVLEQSLSKTLTSYYPFAGRMNSKFSVNCNDMGATLTEARIKCSMSELLNEPTINAQDIVVPSGFAWTWGHEDSSPLVAQLSHFDCGGKALSVCLNHKLGDGATLCNFISHWASVARQASNATPSPQLTGGSMMPPTEDPSTEPLFLLKEGKHCITHRYVFDAEKLSELKAKASVESGVQNPSRVEVASALLYKSSMAASRVCSGSFNPSILLNLTNLRPVIGPPFTQTFVGNFVSAFPILVSDEKQLNFSKLVGEIRKAKIQFYEKQKGIKLNELVSSTLEMAEQFKELRGSTDIDEYFSTSACRFPTYEIDFGWGKPTRCSFGANTINNVFVLMDNYNGDGMEAFVTLEEEVMSQLRNDPELSAFASKGSNF